MLWTAYFCQQSLGPLVPLGEVITNHRKFFWLITFYPMMKHFYPDGSDLFPDDPTHIYKVQY